jgi:hypothetical protein
MVDLKRMLLGMVGALAIFVLIILIQVGLGLWRIFSPITFTIFGVCFILFVFGILSIMVYYMCGGK